MGNERIRTVLEDLEQTLLQFIAKHRITHGEYRAATTLLIDEVKAGEESLLFDVFFEAAATDMSNTGRAGSIEAIEGPFYVPGAPRLEGPDYAMPQRADEVGDVLVFTGRVTTTQGTPLAGVELDIWHADANGEYSQIHYQDPKWNLRGTLTTNAAGEFTVRTIFPPPYEIPKHGPTGRVLTSLGRHFFRPAHLHLKLRGSGITEMTSQLYFPGGEYLENDVANAVRDGLMLEVARHGREEAASFGLSVDEFYTARYDFAIAVEAQ